MDRSSGIWSGTTSASVGTSKAARWAFAGQWSANFPTWQFVYIAGLLCAVKLIDV